VLQDEDQIKDDADIAQSQLNWVARDATPIVLKSRIDDELQDWQDASGEVE